MGIFGPETRRIDGENYLMEASFPDQGQARSWADVYRSYGFKVRIIPNANSKKFEIWVSEFQTSGNSQPPPQVQQNGQIPKI